jgi:hypothetical protein
MKKHLLLLLTAALLLTIASCGGKQQSSTQQTEGSEWVDAADNINRDSTIYGNCTEGSAMHTLQIVQDNGDTLSFNLMVAQEEDRVYGGFRVGDRMAVLASRDHTYATMVLNLSTLMGDWVTPNPLDGSSVMGFSLREGGVMESINQSSVIYKTWRLINGQLEIVSIREGGGDFEEVETFRFKQLTTNELTIINGDEIFEYTRPGQEDDLNGIEIDESEDNIDDMLI